MAKLILGLCLMAIVPSLLASQLKDVKYGLVKLMPNSRDQVDILRKYALTQKAGAGEGGQSDMPLFITPLAKNKEVYVLLPFAGSKKFHEFAKQKHIQVEKIEFTNIESVQVDNSIHVPKTRPNKRAGRDLTVIESPRVTNWGAWGNWEECPVGQFVVGMKLKVEAPIGIGDDTALNGIALLCAVPDSAGVKEITSLVGPFGVYGATRRCPGGLRSLVTGFELRSEEDQGNLYDDTAANNLRLICGQFDLIGDGTEWGDWTGKQYCPNDQAVCGLRTQVEPQQGAGDDSALNNVDMMCCDITADAQYQQNRTQQQQQQAAANNYRNQQNGDQEQEQDSDNYENQEQYQHNRARDEQQDSNNYQNQDRQNKAQYAQNPQQQYYGQQEEDSSEEAGQHQD